MGAHPLVCVVVQTFDRNREEVQSVWQRSMRESMLVWHLRPEDQIQQDKIRCSIRVLALSWLVIQGKHRQNRVSRVNDGVLYEFTCSYEWSYGYPASTKRPRQRYLAPIYFVSSSFSKPLHTLPQLFQSTYSADFISNPSGWLIHGMFLLSFPTYFSRIHVLCA